MQNEPHQVIHSRYLKHQRQNYKKTITMGNGFLDLCKNWMNKTEVA